jgi:hypothetical protein
MTEKEAMREWVILELMGHRRLAGLLTEVEIAGEGMLRLDVPSDPPATQFYSPKAVYCITPTTEALARAFSVREKAAPVSRWELPQIEAGPRTIDADREDDGEEEEDGEIA